MPKDILVEVAAFTPVSAIKAEQGGADRIELCSGYSEGGLSPSVGTVLYVRQQVSIPLHVMVRPRVGDFLYNDAEILAMEKEILFYKDAGADGIVLGVLNEEGHVDIHNLNRLIAAARPMSVTFHRAFDLSSNMDEALEDLINCGVDRVLTSGGKASAIEGQDNIRRLVQMADDNIEILAGGGLSADNILSLIEHTGVKEVHLSGKRLVHSTQKNKRSDLTLTDEGEISDHRWYECDPQLIQSVKKVLK